MESSLWCGRRPQDVSRIGARAYLRASIGVRAYDPLDDGAGTVGYDPLPAEVINELLIADPEVTSP